MESKYSSESKFLMRNAFTKRGYEIQLSGCHGNQVHLNTLSVTDSQSPLAWKRCITLCLAETKIAPPWTHSFPASTQGWGSSQSMCRSHGLQVCSIRACMLILTVSAEWWPCQCWRSLVFDLCPCRCLSGWTQWTSHGWGACVRWRHAGLLEARAEEGEEGPGQAWG